jgi:hypothetical protein
MTLPSLLLLSIHQLLLSVVGAFWAQKSVTCIATALLLSATFQVLHTAYWPFKLSGCNQLQQICLSVLNIVYIAGEAPSKQIDPDPEMI